MKLLAAQTHMSAGSQGQSGGLQSALNPPRRTYDALASGGDLGYRDTDATEGWDRFADH